MSAIKYTSAGSNKWGLVQGESIEYEFSDKSRANIAARIQAFVGLVVVVAVIVFLVVKF